jgi:hypothetical protein
MKKPLLKHNCFLSLVPSRFAIIEPIERPAVGWFTSGLNDITIEYSKLINGLSLPNVMIIKRCDLPAQKFDEKKIHLTTDSGKQFVKATLYYASKFFEAEMINLEDAENPMDVATGEEDVNMIPLRTEEEMDRAKETLEQRLEEMERRMEARSHNDNLVFARIREELDYLANVKKEDRVVVTGLTSTTAMPTGFEEGKKWIDDLVGAALNEIVPESSDKIQFTNSGRSYRGEVPVCEVKMREKTWAAKIRKEYGKLRKDGKTVVGGVFIANSVTLATRVRLEVLKAIGKKCSNEEEDMHVMGFTSRPVLQVKRRDGGGRFVLTYVDAIVRYGGRIGESDLRLAYERAGLTFRGQMSQNFVVLNDKGVRQGGRASGRGGAGGRPQAQARGSGINKRQREASNGSGNNSAKKPMGGGFRGGARGGSRGGRGGSATGNQ